MTVHPVVVRKSLQTQLDLRRRREHCSADARALSAVGITARQQVRVKRNDEVYALYTVSEVRTENADNVVRMGLTGRERLDTDEEFDAEFDSQVVHPTMSDKEAEENGEFIERLHDDGQHTGLIVIAPHGGDIEAHTDDQAQRVASCLADTAVSYLLCKGYHARGAEKTWHITSVDINPGSFPMRNSVFSRRFTDAVAFHGFERDEILVGGAASAALKVEIASAIEKAVAARTFLFGSPVQTTSSAATTQTTSSTDSPSGGRMASRSSRAWGREPSTGPTSPRRSRVCTAADDRHRD